MKQIINELSKEVTKLKDRGEIGLFAELKLQNIINKLKESVNCKRCSTELNDGCKISFNDWLRVNCEPTRNLHLFIKNKQPYFKHELMEMYEKE